MKKRLSCKIALALVVIVTGAGNIKAQDISTRFPLVPYPQTLTAGTGLFVINAQTVITTSANKFKPEAALLNELLHNKLSVKSSETATAKNTIQLVDDQTLSVEEGYRLQITPQQVVIKAKDGAGAFRAIQTIRQLLPAGIENK